MTESNPVSDSDTSIREALNLWAAVCEKIASGLREICAKFAEGILAVLRYGSGKDEDGAEPRHLTFAQYCQAIYHENRRRKYLRRIAYGKKRRRRRKPIHGKRKKKRRKRKI